MKKKTISLPTRQMIVTLVTVLTTITVIALMMFEIFRISNQYDLLINEFYENIHHTNLISQTLYRHEATIFEQLSLLDNETEPVRADADRLKDFVNDQMYSLGKNVKGTAYESYYHSIASSCSDYFKMIDYIYDFLDKGDISTAQFYMDQNLKKALSATNENIDKLSDVMHNDMHDVKTDMDKAMKAVYLSSVIVLFIIIALGIISILITRSISNSIAYRDSLTKTGNQEFVMLTGEKLYRKGKLWRYIFISLSIKDFKYFNNNFGGDAGDHILRCYAANIKNLLQSDEYVGRTSGDNFVVLLKKDHLDNFLDHIKYMDINMEDDKAATFSTVYTRCGIYKIQKEDSISTALNRANLALFNARISKSEDFVVFTEDMIENIIDEKNISSEFRAALENGEFEVYYQPRVDIRENMLCGAEALVRWNRNGALLLPESFIPALENDGCITDLDLYVFERVCRDIRKWMDSDLGIVRISSNFSGLCLKRPDFVESLVDRIDQYGISKSLLEVELPSAGSIKDIGILKRYVDDLRNRNIHVSFNRFGYGYSSVMLVKELNITGVKLDRTLLEDVEKNEMDTTSSNLYKNVANMLKDLGRRVVCVGVETYEQVEFLRSINCNTVQGFYYDRPLTGEQFAERLTKKRYQD